MSKSLFLLLGIICYIAFLDDNFKSIWAEIPAGENSDFADEDKSVSNSSSLKPVLSKFFVPHFDFHLDIFLDDFFFDTIKTYEFLKNNSVFEKQPFDIIQEMRVCLVRLF